MKTIYILLTRSGTLLSNLVYAVTGANYTHASLAFDEDLSCLYSSTRKNGYTMFPDWEKTVKVRLYRKYPVYGWLRSFMSHVVGGTFEGSMTKDFEDGKRLYEIADTPVIEE